MGIAKSIVLWAKAEGLNPEALTEGMNVKGVGSSPQGKDLAVPADTRGRPVPVPKPSGGGDLGMGGSFPAGVIFGGG